jgi:hypothetical protein
MKKLIKHHLLALVLFIGFSRVAQAAVSFTVTPMVVSNTYFGPITLQISNLTVGDTVVVQKYLDANTNGIVDAGDWLWQQFTLTDGSASVFTNGAITVTNFNVPCDLDGTTNGSITAKLNQSADFAQRIVGKYLFVLSSPVGHFSPFTNAFTITNFPFAQKFTGNVVSNGTSTTVSNALVLIGVPDSAGNLNFFAGATANNSGAYSLQVPPGHYMLVAVRSNFVCSLNAVTNQFLVSGATITTNLNLIPATRTISGKIVDAANNSIGIPGFLQAVGSSSGYFGGGITDSNGNFTIGVTADQWGLAHGNQAMMLHGYLTLNSNPSANTTSGNVSGLTIALKKATALYYGSVTDPSGNPLPGVWMFAEDNIDENSFTNAGEGVTDVNGNYVMEAIGGGSTWQLGVDNSLFFPVYSFSPGEQPTIGVGQAVRFDVTATPTVPVITSSAFTGSGHFQVAAIGLTGVNYTLQMSTNLSSTSWTPLLVTNLVGTTFQFTDTAATNAQSFYRVLIGPLNW